MALSCKYVDDVVIGAPCVLTEDLIKSLNIHKVVNVISKDDLVISRPEHGEHEELDPFAYAKILGIYHEVQEDPEEMTIEKIASRVESNQTAYTEKVTRKLAAQEVYYQNKT